MRDFTEDLAALSRRVEDARGYLRVDAARARVEELDKAVAAPDLWDDPERARQVTAELARLRDDVEVVDRLDARLSDVSTLFDLGREENDDSVEVEVAAGVAD